MVYFLSFLINLINNVKWPTFFAMSRFFSLETVLRLTVLQLTYQMFRWIGALLILSLRWEVGMCLPWFGFGQNQGWKSSQLKLKLELGMAITHNYQSTEYTKATWLKFIWLPLATNNLVSKFIFVAKKVWKSWIN